MKLKTSSWDEYYKMVKESRSYRRYREQAQAAKVGDFATVKRLAEEAREQRKNKDWELSEPGQSFTPSTNAQEIDKIFGR